MSKPLPVVDHLSYSGASSWNRCPRQGWLRYVGGVITPASAPMIHGKAVDDLLSSWLVDKPPTTLLDVPEDVLRDAMALWDMVEGWDVVGVQVRHEGRISGVDVPVIGYSDAILADGTVVDFKCSRMNRLPDWTIQTSLYHLLPSEHSTNGVRSIIARVYNGKVTVTELEVDVEAAAQYVRDAWETLSAPLHPATPGQSCGWCSVSAECAVLNALEATV